MHHKIHMQELSILTLGAEGNGMELYNEWLKFKLSLVLQNTATSTIWILYPHLPAPSLGENTRRSPR